jgi:hypothetical protein
MKLNRIGKLTLIIAVIIIVVPSLYYYLLGQYIDHSDVGAFLSGRSNRLDGYNIRPRFPPK